MPYSADIVQQARRRLDSQREDRQSQYNQRLREAYDQLPRLRQLDQQMRSNMAKAACAAEFIDGLAEGYDTVIGERGVRLSGGQKQRLCIARVFLKNPPILILDEATSALDNATEILIQQALDELCKGRTTLVVAHRLSTIKNAHEIAVVSEGKIKEQGSHEALMTLDGIYSGLYKQQFRETEQ